MMVVGQIVLCQAAASRPIECRAQTIKGSFHVLVIAIHDFFVGSKAKVVCFQHNDSLSFCTLLRCTCILLFNSVYLYTALGNIIRVATFKRSVHTISQEVGILCTLHQRTRDAFLRERYLLSIETP